jgi:photosynthetic reaction center cytochrome c subunit
MSFPLKIAGAFAVMAGVGLAFTFRTPANTYVQRGYRGLAVQTNYHNSDVAKLRALNVVPPPEPLQDPAGQPASEVYQNLHVLKHVDANEFLRVMASITSWVAPQQQCTYCHNQENLALDTNYRKIVARRMFQMVEHINTDWKVHVAGTGVTCYTCHRGNPVPKYHWFNEPPTAPALVGGLAEVNIMKNLPSPVAGYSALPSDPLTPFLEQSKNIRVASAEALPGSDPASIKQTDWTYSLMMFMSNSLGVNCTYCHNTRAFRAWDESTPQRATAWYGIRMVRDLNNNFMDKLGGVFPPVRKGPLGDVAKISCMTCHQGVYKPLFGVSMLKTYPELAAGGQVDTTADIGYVNDYTAPP